MCRHVSHNNTFGTAPNAVPTALLALAFSFTLASTQSSGVDTVVCANDTMPLRNELTAEAKGVFPPETEAKFRAIWKKTTEEMRPFWADHMKVRIAQIAKITGLNREGMAALEEASKAVIEKCLEEWMPNFDKNLHAEFLEAPAPVMARIEEGLGQGDSYSNENSETEHGEPENDPGWSEVVKRTLTSDQNANWAKYLDDQSQAIAKDREEYLLPMAKHISAQFRLSALAKIAPIQRTLALSKDRNAALEAFVDSVVRISTARWMKRVGKELAIADLVTREQIKMGQVRFGVEMGEMPGQQVMWQDGLAKMLTSEELQRVAESKRERRARRVHALGQIMLVEMDEFVAFTASQRSRLQSVAARLVDSKTYFSDTQPNDDDTDDLYPALFFAAALGSPENEMTAILDPWQWKRWREADRPRSNETQELRSREARGESKSGGLAMVEKEPEDFWSSMSDLGCEMSAPVRKRLLNQIALTVEEVVRVAGLGADSDRRLLIAARGAVEQSLALWKTNANDVIRTLLGDGSVALSTQALSGLRSTIEGLTAVSPTEQPVWRAAVLAELNSEQTAKWQKEIVERDRFKSDSIALLALAEFDRKVGISGEQWEKLEPMIARNAASLDADYSGRDPQWFLRHMLIPLAGVDEIDLNRILSKQQVTLWREYDQFATATGFWSTHQRTRGRLKAGK